MFTVGGASHRRAADDFQTMIPTEVVDGSIGPEQQFTGPKRPEKSANSGFPWAASNQIMRCVYPANGHLSAPTTTQLKIVVSPVRIWVSPLDKSPGTARFLIDCLPASESFFGPVNGRIGFRTRLEANALAGLRILSAFARTVFWCAEENEHCSRRARRSAGFEAPVSAPVRHERVRLCGCGPRPGSKREMCSRARISRRGP